MLIFEALISGDNGAGLGASHQTGWTGLLAKLIQVYGFLDPQELLAEGKGAALMRGKSQQ